MRHSDEIKLICMANYRFQGYAVATEFEFADVFCMKDNRQTIEIEVKVSRADLMSEVRDVQAIMQAVRGDLFGSGRIPIYGEKHHKHDMYLSRHQKYRDCNITEITFANNVPNQFYFAVPDKLVNVAIEYLKNSPYGVIRVEGSYRSFDNFKVVKKAQKLHRWPCSDRVLFKMAQRACMENISLKESDYFASEYYKEKIK